MKVIGFIVFLAVGLGLADLGASSANPTVGFYSPDEASVRYDSLVDTTKDSLDLDFTGHFATPTTDAALFDVDLGSVEADKRLELMVVAVGKTKGWNAFQLELRLVTGACAKTTHADWLKPRTSALLTADGSSSPASFRPLRGGSRYCVGVLGGAAGKAGDTFLLRNHDDSAPGSPRILAHLEDATA